MGKLANIVLGGIVAASLATSGCTIVYLREHVRPRVIHHQHPRDYAPLLVICYDWPSRDHYCHHSNCYDRYFIELRHRNNQRGEREKQFQYQPEKRAFPQEPKVERRGKLRIETGKPKEHRTAFPKQEKPKRHFQEADGNTGL